MFSRALAKVTAALPSGIKYRLSGLKSIYTFVLKMGGDTLEVQTAAGIVNWKIDNLSSQAFILGTYEPYMQKAFLEFLRPGDVVYDVGAHAGYHSLFCGLLVGSKGQVIAFEPNPDNRASIERQLSVNPILRVSALPYALSDQCASLRLDVSKGSSSQGCVAETGDIEIEARTIDSLVGEGQIPPPHLIKIDVEGHEMQVLKGAVHVLQEYQPVILCDYNDDKTFPMLSHLLQPLKYKVLSGPPVVALPASHPWLRVSSSEIRWP